MRTKLDDGLGDAGDHLGCRGILPGRPDEAAIDILKSQKAVGTGPSYGRHGTVHRCLRRQHDETLQP